MLRMYIAQQCFGLFMTKALKTPSMTARPSGNLLALTCRENLHQTPPPCPFRRLLETHQLTERIFETINALLAAKGFDSQGRHGG